MALPSSMFASSSSSSYQLPSSLLNAYALLNISPSSSSSSFSSSSSSSSSSSLSLSSSSSSSSLVDYALFVDVVLEDDMLTEELQEKYGMRLLCGMMGCVWDE